MFLQGEKILLRALEPEDLDVLYKWENDTELWKYGSSLAPYSKFALRDYLENSLRGIAQTRQLRLMAVLKESGEAVGTVDLYDYDPINARAGVGILVDRHYRKQGIGVEILSLLKEYATRFLMLKQMYASVPQGNVASVNLFAKCGYVQTGLMKSWIKIENAYEDVCFMQLINE